MRRIRTDKVQTSLWLDRDVKRLIEDEGINLTRWVNENVLVALSVDSEGDILGKIKAHESSIKLLNSRLKSIQERETKDDKESSVKKQALDELREIYLKRGGSGGSRENQLNWITSARNIGRCKILRKPTETVLNELEAWHEGLQTD